MLSKSVEALLLDEWFQRNFVQRLRVQESETLMQFEVLKPFRTFNDASNVWPDIGIYLNHTSD